MVHMGHAIPKGRYQNLGHCSVSVCLYVCLYQTGRGFAPFNCNFIEWNGTVKQPLSSCRSRLLPLDLEAYEIVLYDSALRLALLETRNSTRRKGEGLDSRRLHANARISVQTLN